MRIWKVIFGLLLVTGLAFSGEETILKGEILDLSCYLKVGAKGPDHQQCALTCLKNGSPMGLLTEEGEIYLLLEDLKKKDGYTTAKESAAETVEIKGQLAERNGLKALVVNTCSKI